MPCPRWDSNVIPSPGSTGKWRKHAESGPNRPLYGPVRRLMCAHCAHPQICPSARYNREARLHRGNAARLFAETPGWFLWSSGVVTMPMTAVDRKELLAATPHLSREHQVDHAYDRPIDWGGHEACDPRTTNAASKESTAIDSLSASQSSPQRPPTKHRRRPLHPDLNLHQC